MPETLLMCLHFTVNDQTNHYKSSVLLQIKYNMDNIKLIFFNQVRH